MLFMMIPPLNKMLLLLIIMYSNGVKCIIKVLTDSERSCRFYWMHYGLIVLRHLLICVISTNELSTAELCWGPALAQLRICLIHLLWTQTAIRIDKSASRIRIWWTIIYIIIVFSNSTPCLCDLGQLRKVTSYLAIIASSYVWSRCLIDVRRGPSTAVPWGEIVVATHKTCTTLIMLSVYRKIILMML